MDSILMLFRKLSRLIRRKKFDDELEEEIAFHREEAERHFREDGMSLEEAHYAAMRQFGNATRLKEESHETVAFQFETLWKDLRYSVRQLRKNPGFAVTAIVILALGIGACTAIFSAVNPILFEPLPYPHPSRVVMIFEMRSDGSDLDATFGTFTGLSHRNRSFEAIAVTKPWQPTIVSHDQPERFEGQRVSAEYFRVLGVQPVLGRDFQAADDVYHGPNVVILGDALWRRRFGGDPAVIGRQVTLDDNLYTVIGIMPPRFENVLAPAAQIWAPLQYNPTLPSDGREWGHHLRMVGRLLPGVSKNQAASELTTILHTWAPLYAKGYDSSGGAPSGVAVVSLQDEVTRAVRPALLAVLGAVMLLLLIACVNVTNLWLARGAQRRGEFAMRAALGAGRGRLLRQLLTESLLMAMIGGTLGIMIAAVGLRALVALSPAELPRIGAIRIDGAVFAFSAGITTLIGLAVGIFPALYAFHADLRVGIQENSRRAAGGHQLARRALVVAEVALALVLLVSAGLLLRSLAHLFAIDPGFDSSHVLTMQIQEYGHRFDKDEARDRFYKEALESVRRVPGVTVAAFTSQLPMSGDFETYGAELERSPNSNGYEGFRYAVSPQYFETMHIPLLRGRLLADTDRPGSPVAVVISESFAKKNFPGMDPIGQRVRMGPTMGHPDKPWFTVVGVVGDVKQLSLALSDAEAFYTTPSQWAWVDDVQSLVVRTQGDAAVMAPAIRQAIWAVDKDQPIVRVATMDKLLAQSETERHFALIIFEAFALVGLILAATGIYGVLSGNVSERTREIGIRAALGASRSDILSLIVRQGLALAAVGMVIGLVGAAAASQAILTLLFGVSRLDPPTYFGVVTLLLLVAAIACWVPAWRAALVDPAITLRAE